MYINLVKVVAYLLSLTCKSQKLSFIQFTKPLHFSCFSYVVGLFPYNIVAVHNAPALITPNNKAVLHRGAHRLQLQLQLATSTLRQAAATHYAPIQLANEKY